MKILIEIPDDKASFGMQVLKSLSFIKKASPMSTAGVQLWEDLNAAASEVRQHKQGKIQLKTAQQLLNEL